MNQWLKNQDPQAQRMFEQEKQASQRDFANAAEQMRQSQILFGHDRTIESVRLNAPPLRWYQRAWRRVQAIWYAIRYGGE